MGVRTLLKKRIQDITSNITREAERLQGDSKEKFLNIVNATKNEFEKKIDDTTANLDEKQILTNLKQSTEEKLSKISPEKKSLTENLMNKFLTNIANEINTQLTINPNEQIKELEEKKAIIKTTINSRKEKIKSQQASLAENSHEPIVRKDQDKVITEKIKEKLAEIEKQKNLLQHRENEINKLDLEIKEIQMMINEENKKLATAENLKKPQSESKNHEFSVTTTNKHSDLHSDCLKAITGDDQSDKTRWNRDWREWNEDFSNFQRNHPFISKVIPDLSMIGNDVTVASGSILDYIPFIRDRVNIQTNPEDGSCKVTSSGVKGLAQAAFNILNKLEITDKDTKINLKGTPRQETEIYQRILQIGGDPLPPEIKEKLKNVLVSDATLKKWEKSNPDLYKNYSDAHAEQKNKAVGDDNNKTNSADSNDASKALLSRAQQTTAEHKITSNSSTSENSLVNSTPNILHDSNHTSSNDLLTPDPDAQVESQSANPTPHSPLPPLP